MNEIYQLISSVQLGGAEIVAFQLAEHCNKGLSHYPTITVLELYPTRNNYARDKKKELASKNIRVVTLCKGSKRMSLLFAPFSLLRFIWKEQPLVIHSHTDLPDFVVSVAKRIYRLLRLPFPEIIRTIHNTQLWRSYHFLGKFTESVFADEPIVAVSSSAMKAYMELREKHGLPSSRYRRVIFNGCSNPVQTPHSFQIDGEKINIAFCGRFEEYKGTGILARIIPEIGRLYPQRFRFHLIGDGSEKNQLEQLAQENDDVILYDPVPNVASKLYAFDYLLIPSRFEGLGLISIEASLSGVLVVASFAPGLDETLPDAWPLRFNLDKTDELCAIFDNIVKKRYDEEKLRMEVYNYAKGKFTLQKMVQLYDDLYYRLIVNYMNKLGIG